MDFGTNEEKGGQFGEEVEVAAVSVAMGVHLQKIWPRGSRQIKSRQDPRREPWGTPAVEKDGYDFNDEKNDLMFDDVTK